MKKLLFFPLAAFAAFGQTSYDIDGAHSAAQFSVTHMMVSKVRGSLGQVSGTAVFDPKNLAASKVNATVDVAAINTGQAKRDGHLKSPDFFDTEKFPKLTFESTKWWKEGDKVKVAGNLTLRGVTKPVVLDAEISTPLAGPNGSSRIGAQITTKINRKDFGVNWSKSMDGGGVVVSDEVAVTLDIEATSKASK
ncbi:MAG: YceI family protein [Acidobacteria bacterium]|nr:YceI family protein [Acidobacteriota bacterium]